MRTWATGLSVVAVVAMSAAATADVLELANGGKLNGSLQEVTFLVQGKPRSFSSEEVAGLRLSETTSDVLRLAGNTEVKGELISVKFRSMGGALSFPRKDLAGLTFGTSKLQQARTQLTQKAAGLDKTDPSAVVALAEWCSQKSLNAEARQYAKLALDLNPDEAVAVRAKRLLGIATAPKDAGPELEPAEPEKPEKPKSDLTPEQAAAIKEAATRNEALYRQYRAKVDDLRKKEFDQASAIFSQMDKIKSKLKGLAQEAKRRRKDIDRQAEEYKKKHPGSSSHVASYRQKMMRNVTNVENQIKVAKREAYRYVACMKKAGSYVSDRSSKRHSNVRLIYNKCQRLLFAGNTVDPGKLEQAYQKAIDLGGLGLKDVEVDWRKFKAPKIEKVNTSTIHSNELRRW
jgi:hypothetical protein